jgi:APA family basic amino acid/polyamine antiporter
MLKRCGFNAYGPNVLAVSGKFGDLLTYTASLLFYILTIFGLFILREKEPDTERPYKAFGYHLYPQFILWLRYV